MKNLNLTGNEFTADLGLDPNVPNWTSDDLLGYLNKEKDDEYKIDSERLYPILNVWHHYCPVKEDSAIKKV